MKALFNMSTLLALIALSFGLQAIEPQNAVAALAPEKIDAATQAEMHRYLCSGPKVEALKDQEIKEMRDGLLHFLTSPAQASKEILDEGSKDDVGPFPLLAMCAMIVGLEDILVAKGCMANDGSNLNAAPALNLCKAMFTQLAK